MTVHPKQKPFNPRQLLWIVPLGLLVIVGCVYLSWVLQAPQREQAVQIERLNANTAKLKEVKEKLEKELPNVKKASFEKSCGQEYQKYSEGTIWCGGRLDIVISALDLPSLSDTRGKIGKYLSSGERIKLYLNIGLVKSPVDTLVSSGSYRQNDEYAVCRSSEVYYETVDAYRISQKSLERIDEDGGVYTLYVECVEPTPEVVKDFDIQQ